MPEQQIACAGDRAHAFELRAGDLVASLTVRAMQPEDIGLRAQAQMADDVDLVFARLESAGHVDSPLSIRATSRASAGLSYSPTISFVALLKTPQAGNEVVPRTFSPQASIL